MITDQAGNVVEWLRPAVGDAGMRGRTTATHRIGDAGYQWDPAIQAFHVRHRVYRPDTGSWTRRDPLGYVDGMSVYEYVGSRVVAMTDWSGLAATTTPYIKCLNECKDTHFSQLPGGFPGDWDRVGFEKCRSECREKHLKTPIKYCTRDLVGDDVPTFIGNVLSSHSYLSCGKDSACLQGVEKKGDLPSKEIDWQGVERNCSFLYKSNPHDGRSVEELWNCIKTYRAKDDYHGVMYNCNDWSLGAMRHCGLIPY